MQYMNYMNFGDLHCEDSIWSSAFSLNCTNIEYNSNLQQHLQVASGENRHALHRAQRWYDSTEKAWGFSKGPVNYADLFTHERLDRPIIKVFQRHPGTNMPEAQEIVKVTKE